MLRHTFATRCIESGMQAVTLSRILGHKDISVTLNTYTDVFNQFKQKEVNKLDEYLSGLQSGCSQE
jgi:integrase